MPIFVTCTAHLMIQRITMHATLLLRRDVPTTLTIHHALQYLQYCTAYIVKERR